MKKIISLALILMMVFAFAACSGNKGQENSTGENGNVVNENAENGSNEPKELTAEMVKNAKVADAADFKTEETDDGIIIDEYIGDDEIVSIPETIDGKTVIALGRRSFAMVENLKGVRIPDTVKYIYEEAFGLCGNLEVFISGDGLETIGGYVFNCCKKLRIVELNEGLKKIDAGAFASNTSLKEIWIPDSVEEIEELFDQGITIISKAGSVAEKVAKENGHKFVAR